MTNTTEEPLAGLGKAERFLPWLQLFQGGTYEVVLLTVGQLSPDAWAEAREELAAAGLLRPEQDVTIGSRPFLRFDPELSRLAAEAQPPDMSEARPQFVGAYTALDLAVRQALGGPNPQKGVTVLSREEANYRRAVEWAVEGGDRAIAAVLGGTFGDYLARCGRLGDRDAWRRWLNEALASGDSAQDGST